MAGRFSIEAVFKAVDRVTAPVSRMQNRVGKFTRGMERGLRRANRALDKVVKGLRRGATAALKFGGVAVTAAVGALVIALNRTADAADALAKRTRRIKFPIEEFQEWQFVAEQSGLTTAEFDKSMEKFVKTVGEARAETGTLFTILRKTNPELLAQLQATDGVSDAFEIYIKALRGTENQMDKTALATAGFGRTGAKFLNITEQSSAAVAALRKEQRENGVVTREQAEGAEAYNDALNSLKRSLQGVIQDNLLPLLPLLTKIAKEWREWVVVNREFIRGEVSAFLERIRENLPEIIKSVKSAAKAFVFLAKHSGTILKVVGAVVALALVLKTLGIAMVAVNLVLAASPIGLVVAGVLLLAAAAAAVVVAWEPIKAFFADLWGGITERAEAAEKSLQAIIDRVNRAFASADAAVNRVKSAVVGSVQDFGQDVAGFFGFGGDDEERAGSSGPQVVSPQERTARSIEEQRTTSSAEVTIRDETGRAEVTRGSPGAGLSLQPSGAF